MNEQPGGQPFSDISRATASPASKPVITGVPQPDPMLAVGTPRQLDGVFNRSVQSPQPQQPPIQPVPQSRPQAMPQMPGHHHPVSSLPSAPEATHQLQNPTAFYGDIQKKGAGKKVLIVLICLVLLGGAGFGGWIFYKKQSKTTPAPVANNNTNKTEDKTSTTLFTSKTGGFSVDNVNGWSVTDVDTTTSAAAEAKQYNAKYGKATFAINDTQSITIQNNPGGRGGQCVPAAKDKPFQQGNTCASFSIVSADKLTAKNYPTAKVGAAVQTIYLTKYKYMLAGTTATPITLVGITASTKSDAGVITEPAVGKEEMGNFDAYTVLPLANSSLVIQIQDKTGKPTQLSDADLVKVEDLLKSLKLN